MTILGFTRAFVLKTVTKYGPAVDFCWNLQPKARNLIRRVKMLQPVKQKELPDPFFSKHSLLLLGSSNTCNAKCIFCCYPKITKNFTHGMMSNDLCGDILNQWRAYGGYRVDFSFCVGEPTLDPGLLWKVSHARGLGYTHIAIATNGTRLMHNHLAEELIRCGITRINLSIGGIDRESYKATYGIDAFDSVLQGVTTLLEYNKQCGEPVEMDVQFRAPEKPSQTVARPLFQKHIKPYLSSKVIASFATVYDNWSGHISQADLIGPMRLAKPPKAQSVKTPCRMLFQPSIMWDGTIRACGCRIKGTDRDNVVIGRFQDGDLFKTTPQARKIVEDYFKGVVPKICEGCCNYWPASRSK